MTFARPAGAPARIGRYEILERIGKGAMGVVYRARDEVMDRVVAVKVMMTDLEGESDTRTRFYREAQAAGRLLHPNIITIFDMGEDEGRIYIVMELLKGETLTEFLRRPSVPLEQKLGLMIQTCDGLAAAHASGIVHRDIKPGNLFVLQDGTLKILDFGVARLASSTMTASGFIIGTPDYMSPEQARGGEIDGRSDVFSAGAVFYNMLAGRKPFAARDLPTVLRKVQAEAPPPLSEGEAPPILARIIMRSLAKDPAHRYPSMSDLASDLSRFKRHFDAETRAVAAAARERYDSIQATVRERSSIEERLGLAITGEPACAAKLRQDHPAFVERAPELLLVPFSRSEVTGILAVLSADCGGIEQGLADLRGAAGAADAAEELLRGGQPEEAMARLDAAGSLLPDTPAIGELRARVVEAVTVYHALQRRLDAVDSRARTAAAAFDWETVIACAEEGESLGSPRPALSRLAQQAREALGRQAKERALARQRATGEASSAIAGRRFAEAERAIERARQLDVDAGELEDLALALNQAREASAAEAAVAKQAAEAISLARAEFHAGHRAEALSVLRQCLEKQPEAPGVKRELDHLAQEVSRLEEAERRHARAGEQACAAAASLDARDFASALQQASDALSLEPAHPEALRVRAAAEAGLRAEAEARERLARAREHVARARSLFEAGTLTKALREAQQALQWQADHQEASDLLAIVERRLAEQEAERARAQAFQAELRSARQLLRARDLEGAAAAADRALAIKPGERAGETCRAEIAAERERRERRRLEQEDDTVALSAAQRADADDTVAFAPARAGASGFPGRLSAWLRSLRRQR